MIHQCAKTKLNHFLLQKTVLSPEVEGLCLYHSEEELAKILLSFLCVAGFFTGFLIFLLYLVITEAQKYKNKQKIEAEKRREQYLAAKRRPSARDRHQMEEVENLYEKISPEYLTNFDNDDMDDDIIEDMPDQEYNDIYRRTESYSSFDTPNNAELILRELFVPIQENEVLNEKETMDVQNSITSSVSKKHQRRRKTSDYSLTSKRPSLHSMTVHRESVGYNSRRRSSDRFRNSISSNPVSDDNHQIHHQKRRRALVFSPQLSVFEDSNNDNDNYSTVV